MEDLTRTQIDLLKLRTTMPGMKNAMEGLTANQTAEEKIAHIEYILIKIIQNIAKVEIGFKIIFRTSLSSKATSGSLMYV